MKYLIYLRVSTEKQDVEMQNRMIFNYLNNKHGEGKFSHELFTDPETSTRLLMSKRVGLQEMLSQVKKGDIVLVYKLDRLSRDVIEMVSIYREITREKGATVHSLNDLYCDEFSVGLMGVLAQKERDDTRKKTKDALRNKKEKGERYSGKLPYGYSLHETYMVPIRQGDEIVYKRGVLVEVPQEQEIISRIKEYSQCGMSYQEIARGLNDSGFRNREGNPFQKMTIYRILGRIKQAKSSDQPHWVEELALSPR